MTGTAELFQYRSDTKILSAGDCFYARSTRQRTHSTRARWHSPAQLLPAGLIACRSHCRAATCLVGVAPANANRSSRHAIRSRRSVVRARRVCQLAQDFARPDPFQVTGCQHSCGQHTGQLHAQLIGSTRRLRRRRTAGAKRDRGIHSPGPLAQPIYLTAGSA